MTVKELIERLQKCDPDAVVVMSRAPVVMGTLFSLVSILMSICMRQSVRIWAISISKS